MLRALSHFQEKPSPTLSPTETGKVSTGSKSNCYPEPSASCRASSFFLRSSNLSRRASKIRRQHLRFFYEGRQGSGLLFGCVSHRVRRELAEVNVGFERFPQGWIVKNCF